MAISEPHRDELLKYRIEKAIDTFQEVPVLVKNGFFNTAVNRLYYAAYYAISGLLLKEGYSP